jgi:hypothetical protein
MLSFNDSICNKLNLFFFSLPSGIWGRNAHENIWPSKQEVASDWGEVKKILIIILFHKILLGLSNQGGRDATDM